MSEVEKLADLPGVVREALCGWQFFRQLGYTAQQIFTGCNDGSVYVEARWRGMTFVLNIGMSDMALEEWTQVWERAAALIQTVDHAEFDELWRASMILADATDVLIAMVDKGIYWPDHKNFRKLN